MIRFATLIALLFAAPLFAQTKEIVEEVDALLAQQRLALRHAEERNEDIEVLRRLLNKAFGFDDKTSLLPEALQPHQWGGSTILPSGGSGWAGGLNPGGNSGLGQPLFGGSGQPFTVPLGKRVSQSVGPFDGVYLKGSGVVFTLRVPKDDANTGLCVGTADHALGLSASCGKCHQDIKPGHGAATAKTDCTNCHTAVVNTIAVQPLSDWDRIKADVRGEKLPEVKAPVADPKKPRTAMCKPGDIRELAIAQLHAHAKHLRHLDKNDWVTVVVTFDEVPGVKSSRIPAPTDKPGFTPDELQSLTLADLHLKQGKYADAAIAYEKGLFRFRDGVVRLTFPPTVPAAEVQKLLGEMEKSTRAMYKSLATAYLQLNDLDKAKVALDKATSLKVELATAGAEKAKPQLPAKIVLAVAKSDLDRNPKLDELRKGAHVEMTGFPAVEPAKK